MPTIFEWNGWKFLFYSAEGQEPPHVHVRKDRKELKVWLETSSLSKNRRCSEIEVNAILKVVAEHRNEFLEKWHGHFGN